MEVVRKLIKRFPLGAYFTLAYLISWVVLLPMVGLYLRDKPDLLPWYYLIPAGVGVYGPTFAALSVTAMVEGRLGVGRLLGKLRLWRTGRGWYAVIILVFPLIYVLGTVMYIFLSRENPGFHPEVLASTVLVFLLALPFGPLGEELGWRGFALPRLIEKHGWLGANLILGLLWFCWHLPTMFVPGMALPAVEVTVEVVLQYLWMILGLTFLFSLVYERTNGSILLSILLHASINSTARIINPLFWGRIGTVRLIPVLWCMTAVLWLAVLGWWLLELYLENRSKRQPVFEKGL